MPSTFDSLLRLELQAVGENANTWGVKLNTDLELVAAAIAGHTSISAAGSGDLTLTTANAATDQARQAFLTFTGILTGNRNIIIPSSSKIYYIRNNTTGAFTLTVKTISGAGVVVAQGNVANIACDGTDCFDVEADKVSKSGDAMTGTLALPSGTSVSASQAMRSDEITTRVSTVAGPMISTAISAAVPSGVILMWSGSIASIPSGYVLCNGSSGTPDLRDRFVVGAGSTYAVAATGGAVSGTTSSNGAHSHTGVTGSTTLTEAQIPSHTHGVSDPNHAHALPNSVANFAGGTATFASPGGGVLGVSGATEATGTGISITATGGGAGHTHTISSDGAHTHTVATLPPYYALAFIMKT